MEGFSNLKPKAANSRYKDEVRLDEVLDIYKLPDAELVEMRFLPGPIIALKQHWVKIRAGKDKREIKVSRWCISFDPENEAVANGKHCPYCELSTGENGSQQVSMKYYVNAIIRDLQENEPRNAQKPTKEERKSGFIQRGSKSFTPVRVVALPPSLVEKIQFVEQRNIHTVKSKSGKKEKKAFPISHAKYGIDIGIQFDNSKAGGDKYVIDKGQRTPLTEEEQAYLIWNLNPELVQKLGIKSEEEAAEDFKRMDIIGTESIDDDDDDDDDLGKKKGKKGSKDKSKKAGKSKFDEEDDDDDDEDDEDLGKKSKSKKKKPSKSKFDDDEEEEDDEPVKKKKKSSGKSDKSSKKKKPSKSKFDDDDDDDDEDDEPVKKKKSSKEKSKSSDKKKKKSKK